MPVIRGITILLLLLSGLQAQVGTDARLPHEVRERAGELLRERGCQTELPSPTGASGGEASEPEDPVTPRRGERRRPLDRADSGRGSSWSSGGFSLAEPVLWIAVTLAVALLLASIVRSLRRGGPSPPKPAAPERVVGTPQAPPLPAAADAVPEHSRLAAAGDFAAAVHALLAHAFAHLQPRLGALPIDATGRDLLRLSRQQQLTIDALAELVSVNELLQFGGRTATAEHYQQSLTHYENWRQACAGGQ